MGNIVKIRCKNCNIEQDIKIGAGIRFCNIEIIDILFNKGMTQKLKNTLDKNKGMTWFARNAAAWCPSCKKIVECGVLTLNSADGKSGVYRSKCRCGSEMNLLTEDHACPICKRKMELTVVGHWD
ncbi:MAG: hypothetical protein IJJ65_06665 [Butyrivibrio sp.]|nr:hypothetical protein [Butyrivibrio sp.]